MARIWYPVLRKIDPALKKRLITVITEKYDYFILTGTDPADAGGCCPSGEVAGARLLVEAGILQSTEIAGHPGACPSAMYAFAGEISGKSGGVTFVTNREVRDRVYDHLAGNQHVRDACRVLVRLHEGGPVDDGLWVEDHQVGHESLGHATSIP